MAVEATVSGSALIVIDMLNPYQHRDAEPHANLVSRAHERDDVELIYVNDNYGDFAASRDDLVRGALEGERSDLVEPIVPPDECPFLTKVRHSAFYCTTCATTPSGSRWTR
jgi:hypothetical protein